VLFRSVFQTIQVLFYLGLQAPAALASDLTIKSNQSETLEANDNYFLRPVPKGNTYVPVITASVDASGRNPTTRYDLHGDLSYTKYFGPGAADASLPNVKEDGVSFFLEHVGDPIGDKVNVTGWSRRQDVATAQLNDLGVVTASGEFSTTGIAGGLYRQVSAIDSLTLSVTSTKTDFTSSSGVPFVNLTTGAYWKRRIGPSTDLTASAEFNWTIQDNQAQQDTKFWKGLTGVRMQPTSRLSLSGSAGVGVVSSSQAGLAGIAAPPVPGSTPTFGASGLSIGVLAEAQAVYKLKKTTQLSLSASRSIAPDVLGALSQRTSYGIGLTQAINAASNLSFGGALTQTPPSSGQSGSSPSNFWTANVTYSRRLAPEWGAQLTYNYRRNEIEGSRIISNALVLVLARDMTIRP
jgi:hypothetical protein